MDRRTTEYDIAAPLNGRCASRATRRGGLGARLGHMETTPANPGHLPQRWALLAALVLCVAHSVADTHVHLDEHEEEVCTLCAISEPGHIPGVGQVDAGPSECQRSNSLPVASATLCPRRYEVGRPRAPPIS